MTSPCPVCGHKEPTVLDTIAVKALTRAYEAQLGVSVASWFEELAIDFITRLLCQRCGVQHFDPSPQGDTAFYGLLEGLYPETRWEFAKAASLIDGMRIHVADLGCGPGHFLRNLRGAARRVGNDLNPDLAPGLASLGIEPFVGPMNTMPEHFHQEFDVVTAFHVLEHLRQPSELFETVRAILRPEGQLLVSVPDADRLIVDRAILPLDWPPHHLTRWTPQSLFAAAHAAGFSMDAIHHEPTHTCYRRLRHIPGALAVPIAGLMALVRGGHINLLAVRRDSGWLRSGHAILGVFRRG